MKLIFNIKSSASSDVRGNLHVLVNAFSYDLTKAFEEQGIVPITTKISMQEGQLHMECDSCVKPERIRMAVADFLAERPVLDRSLELLA